MKVNIKVNANSLAMLKKKIKQLEDLSTKELSNELGKTALDSVARMQRSVVVDNGDLSRSISADRLNEKNISISAKANYAPYVEFGTGRGYDPIYLKNAGFDESFSKKFLGKGIREVNLPARPFFFTSLRVEFRNLSDRLENKIKKLTK
jgi:phage gpG-like protein